MSSGWNSSAGPPPAASAENDAFAIRSISGTGGGWRGLAAREKAEIGDLERRDAVQVDRGRVGRRAVDGDAHGLRRDRRLGEARGFGREAPGDAVELHAFVLRHLADPPREGREVGEGRCQLDGRVVDERQLLALVVPWAVRPERDPLARPVCDAAGELAGREIVAQRRREGRDPLDDLASFRSFGAHRQTGDRFFGRDAGLVLSADGDDDFAHEETLRRDPDTQEWRESRIRCILVCSDASASVLWKLNSVTAVPSEEGSRG
jgi:hypothetical protein